MAATSRTATSPSSTRSPSGAGAGIAGRGAAERGARARVFALLLTGASLLGCAAGSDSLAEAPGPVPPPPPAAVRAFPEHGVEIVALRLSAAGRMLDLRYRVTDPGRAAPLLARGTQVFAVDEATGTRLAVPRGGKVGAMRQTSVQPEAGRVYFTFFGNPGVVRRGSVVTLRFGAVALPGVVVE